VCPAASEYSRVFPRVQVGWQIFSPKRQSRIHEYSEYSLSEIKNFSIYLFMSSRECSFAVECSYILAKLINVVHHVMTVPT
jgi:hypothetical protein